MQNSAERSIRSHGYRKKSVNLIKKRNLSKLFHNNAEIRAIIQIGKLNNMSIAGIFKPEYIFRPRNVLSRLLYRPQKYADLQEISLFGSPFWLNPNDVIGHQIVKYGLFDLVVSEALTRLVDPGETVVDVGSNVGYMARLLAHGVGSAGKVIAFEPHPELFKVLKRNVSARQIVAIQAAVSDHAGVATLNIPTEFGENCGIATLEPGQSSDLSIDVKCTTLDLERIRIGFGKIGLIKIDIEGHELAALKGAHNLLFEKAIRDIVFEEHNVTESSVAAYLTSLGYSVFRLHKRFSRPELLDPLVKVKESGWESPSFLATVAPDRALNRFQKVGWECL